MSNLIDSLNGVAATLSEEADKLISTANAVHDELTALEASPPAGLDEAALAEAITRVSDVSKRITAATQLLAG